MKTSITIEMETAEKIQPYKKYGETWDEFFIRLVNMTIAKKPVAKPQARKLG